MKTPPAREDERRPGRPGDMKTSKDTVARRHAELLRRAARGELQSLLAGARQAERRALVARLRARAA
jgi:hypothetical protein